MSSSRLPIEQTEISEHPESSGLPDNQGEFATGFAGRVRAAHGRYGGRALFIALHRLLCNWPQLRSRAIRFKIRLLLKSEVAATVSFGKDIVIMIPGGFLAIGKNTRVGDRCFIEGWPNPRAEIRIGMNCYLAHDIQLAACGTLVIGNNVRIAEFTSLRDTTHNYKDRSTNINQQGDTVGQLFIKDDVWIGQGCLIQGSPEGSVIGQGAVIGAHSVVKESVPDYAIAVGAPARVVGYRE